MIAAGRDAVDSADIVKLSGEELAMLSGANDAAEGVRRLWHPRLKVMAVTSGGRGAVTHTQDWSVAVDGFAVEVVDTVGCGDAFMASLLAGLLSADFADIDRAGMAGIGRCACAAGAVIATRAGAMARMPRPDEIDRVLATATVEAT